MYSGKAINKSVNRDHMVILESQLISIDTIIKQEYIRAKWCDIIHCSLNSCVRSLY